MTYPDFVAVLRALRAKNGEPDDEAPSADDFHRALYNFKERQ
ncbi:MAG: hypothetical protein WB816_16035 [Methylocystis sp.]